MKQIAILVALCLFFVIVTNALSEEDKIEIKLSWAFMNRFQPESQHLGTPEGNVLQAGCMVKPAGSPIKEVTVKNLDTGLVLTAQPVDAGKIWSGLYEVFPMQPFDPSKHMGVWEISVIDEKGNKAMVKTNKLDIKGVMPFLENVKASGNPLAPMISWSAPNEKDLPQGVAVRYRVRLLTDFMNQFYRSQIITTTTHQIPEGTIKSEEDLSKIYIRIECQGWDKNDKVHPSPLDLSSQTFKPLNKALGK